MMTGAGNETEDLKETQGSQQGGPNVDRKNREADRRGGRRFGNERVLTENVDAGVPIKAPHHHPLSSWR
jgi:hypothetical protein